jgi:adenylate kinase family enzyme
MERVAVIGSPGSGKTTFSKALSERTHVDVTHLDHVYWRPGWVETPVEHWRELHGALIEAETWIIDGAYISTLAARLARADTVIVFDVGRLRCLARALRRTLRNYGRVVQAPGCPERFDAEFLRYIWIFPREIQPKIEDELSRFASSLTVVRLRTNDEVRHYLAQWPSSRAN